MVLEHQADSGPYSREFVCPLCPLHCDDVRVDVDGRLDAHGCPVVQRFPLLHKLPADRGDVSPQWDAMIADAMIAGEMIAGETIAELGQLGLPLRVITTGVDLTTARLLSNLQAAGHIEVTIESDPSVQAVLDVATRDGIVTATLADVAVHAEVVWMIGAVEATWPRLTEKIRRCDPESDSRRVSRWANCSAAELTEFAAAIRSESAGSGATGGHSKATLAGEARRWRDARYSVILIGPGAFAQGEEAIAATMLARLVRLQNATSRSVLITLDAAATLRSVSLWKTNTAPAMASLGSAQQLFDIRIGNPLNEHSHRAKVQYGGKDPGPSQAAAYRQGSVAGLHRRGMVIRGDGSVSLALDRILPA